MVDAQPHAMVDRRELVKENIKAVARRVGARLDESITSAKRASLQAGEADGHPLPSLGTLDRMVVHVHAPDACLEPRRFDAEPVARPHRSRPKGSRCDRSD